MNKTELSELYDRVQTNWGAEPLVKAMRIKALEVWWRYLAELPADLVSQAIDARALAGGYPPRPGELFTQVLVTSGTAPPSAAQALVDSKTLLDAVRYGTNIPTFHPLVAQTVSEVGTQRDDVFLKVYEERRQRYLTDLFANPPAYFDGANMNQEEER